MYLFVDAVSVDCINQKIFSCTETCYLVDDKRKKERKKKVQI